MKIAPLLVFGVLTIGPVFAENASPGLVGYLQLQSDKELSTQRGLVSVVKLREGDVVRFREVGRGEVEGTVSHLTRGRVAPGNVPRLELVSPLDESSWVEDLFEYNATIVLPAMALTGFAAVGPMQFAVTMGCTFALLNTPTLPFFARSVVARAKRKTNAVWLTDVKPRDVPSRMTLIL